MAFRASSGFEREVPAAKPLVAYHNPAMIWVESRAGEDEERRNQASRPCRAGSSYRIMPTGCKRAVPFDPVRPMARRIAMPARPVRGSAC
jgi:hypothetical protein